MEGLRINLSVLSVVMMLFICRATSNLHPVILVPGNGGNQLEARLTDKYKASSLLCNRWLNKKDKDGWFRLWFDVSVVFAPFTKCFAEQMTLCYDPYLDDYHNAPGVETRVPHFGSVQSLLYLDPYLKHITTYMATLVESLEKLGYVDGETLFGAPYDFRYGLASPGHPSKVGSKFLDDLKQLIEHAYTSNGGKPVILVSHSLGGLFVLQLLNRNPKSWRDQYVRHFIALSTPWGGTVETMLAFASGNTLGIPFVNPLLVREEQRSSESNLWLLPSPTVFGGNVLVISNKVNYKAIDIVQFLEDTGAADRILPYETRTLPLVEIFIPPEIPVTCIVGSGIKTPETLFYGEEGFDKQPEIVHGDGDGTVNMVSLLALDRQWAETRNQTLKVIKIPGVSHTNILKDATALQHIIGEIYCSNSRISGSFVSMSK